jgi:ubiquinone/menaquinone biosynthesis C-methylase UbiE
MKETSNYKKYRSKNSIQKILIQHFINSIIMCLKDLDLKTVLDAGCGEGFILWELKKRGLGGYFEGIDYSKDAVDMGSHLFPSLIFSRGDIYNLPHKDNSFDLILCSEVMEHVEQPEKALDEIVRVARKYCLLTVPNEPFFMLSNFLRGKNLSRWGSDMDHVQHWNYKEFEKFIKTRLDIVKVKKPFPWTLILGKKSD